ASRRPASAPPAPRRGRSPYRRLSSCGAEYRKLAPLRPPRGMRWGMRTFFGHPRGLQTLFFTEMWERFSYYGMRAILILFMVAAPEAGGLGFSDVKAGMIYGIYTAMVYLVSLPGGWIADRFLGQRRAVLYGGVLIMMGHICLAIPILTTFYMGLVLIVLGTGLLKPNISTIVGQLYTPEDERRDGGFTIYYMGIKIGALRGSLACSLLTHRSTVRGCVGRFSRDPYAS